MVTPFDLIYQGNLWNGEESLSGPGSGTAATSRTSVALTDLAAALAARSVLDVGCGDGFWTPDFPGYVGVDVSREAIRLHRERHPDRDVWLDEGGALPYADLTIVRFVMQHLSLDDGRALLDRILASGPRVIAATTYRDGVNADIPTGIADGVQTAYRIDLTRDPFRMGRPFAVIPDGWDYSRPGQMRDPDCVLGLWRGR